MINFLVTDAPILIRDSNVSLQANFPEAMSLNKPSQKSSDTH